MSGPRCVGQSMFGGCAAEHSAVLGHLQEPLQPQVAAQGALQKLLEPSLAKGMNA